MRCASARAARVLGRAGAGRGRRRGEPGQHRAPDPADRAAAAVDPRPRPLAALDPGLRRLAAIAGLGPVFNLVSRGSMWGGVARDLSLQPRLRCDVRGGRLLERAPAPDLGFGRYLPVSGFSFVLPRDMKLFPDFDPLGWPAMLGNFSQSNLSLAQFATVFFDFGLPGPLVFGFLLSSLFRRGRPRDRYARPVSRGYLAALVLLAAYVPFMRGPILGWGPFAASGLIAALLVGALCTGFGPARRALAPRPATQA